MKLQPLSEGFKKKEIGFNRHIVILTDTYQYCKKAICLDQLNIG